MKLSPSDEVARAASRPANPVPPYVVGACISFACFLLAVVLARNTLLFDLPVARMINQYADRSLALDLFFYDLDHYATFSGIVVMSLVWFCWFGVTSVGEHAKILVGSLIAFPVGMVSRFLQHKLSTHPRPVYDPALGFHYPSILEKTPLNTWNSFPSDHATAFGALVVVVVSQRPKLAWFLVPWFVLLESARVFMGAHYPSDLLGGVALGATAVFAAQAPWVLNLGQVLVRWGRSSPPAFYMLAFFISYQVATLFSDIRYAVGGVTLLKLLKFW